MEDKDINFIHKQTVIIEDPFTNRDNIIDLGGGGEGVIGVLRGNQVTAIDLRQDELDEAPDGPIKVIADARNLPFENEFFTAATAFFFLMYVESTEREKILREAYRVLKDKSFFYIWDVSIPKPKVTDKKIFALYLEVIIGNKVINTGYGTKWENKAMTCEEITSLAKSVGFKEIETIINDQIFYIQMQK